MTDIRTIKVTGKGKLKVHPDTTRITITVTGLYKDYGETIQHSSQDTETLKNLLSEFGFERTDLKTLRFDVDSRYESYTERNVSKKRFLGYEFSHTMKIEFDSDNTRLGKILYALAKSDIHPEFRISYTVKDSEAAKNELLGKAVKDAMAKAAVLTDASGVNLKDILSIDYSWGEIDFEVSPINRHYDLMSYSIADGSFDMDIEPDDIEVSDTVTVVWEIA